MNGNEYRVIYEAGVFKPLDAVSVPEHKVLVLVEKPDAEEASVTNDDDIPAVLVERYDSGENDVAARHNEHQP